MDCRKISLLLLFFALISAVGAVDYLTGHGLSFSLFYWILIVAASWVFGTYTGMVLSVYIALLWTGGDVLSGKPYRFLFAPYWNFIVRVILFSGVALMASRLKNTVEKEKIFARKDFITGLANWQAFSEVASREIERVRRYKRPLTVAYIDCDNFKAINDSLGHQAGNDVLRSLATVIQDNIRTVDMAARLGGDEFVVLLPETDHTASQAVILRLHNHLLEKTREKGTSVTCSIGVATFTQAPNSVEDMIRVSDSLMYEAKRSGKNTVKHHVFS